MAYEFPFKIVIWRKLLLHHAAIFALCTVDAFKINLKSSLKSSLRPPLRCSTKVFGHISF